MRKIKLEPVLEFGSRCDFAIIDVTESNLQDASASGKKRGIITIDYAPSDVRQLISEGKDLDGTLQYYHDRIYSLVKYYISGDWECVSGYEDAMAIVKRHIIAYFK